MRTHIHQVNYTSNPSNFLIFHIYKVNTTQPNCPVSCFSTPRAMPSIELNCLHSIGMAAPDLRVPSYDDDDDDDVGGPESTIEPLSPDEAARHFPEARFALFSRHTI